MQEALNIAVPLMSVPTAEQPGEVSTIDTTEPYGIYAIGPTMDPVHLNGDLVFINPNREPRIGECVLISFRRSDGSTGLYLRILRERTEAEIVIEQYNPVKRWVIDADSVIFIHPTMKTGEWLRSGICG